MLIYQFEAGIPQLGRGGYTREGKMDRKFVPPLIWCPWPEGGLSSQRVGRGERQPGADTRILTFHWSEPGHVAMLSCKGSWEMQSNDVARRRRK